MRRRDLLRAAGAAGTAGLAGLAGCAGRFLPRGRGDDRRRVSVAGTAAVPAELAVSIDVELLDPVADADSPPRLRVRTTNGGDRRRLSVGEEGCAIFNRADGKSDPPGVWLHRAGTTDGIDRRGERWTRDRDPDQHRRFPAYGCLPKTYAPGESVATEYVLWDDYRVEGYMPPDTYRFRQSVAVTPPEGGEGPSTEFEWWVDLSVERPGN